MKGPARIHRVFIDMDGVIVDFDAYLREHGITGDEAKCRPGAYLAMQPIQGALAAVRSIIGAGFEVWIATKPPTGIPFAYADKAAWVMEHLPELKRRIIVTHHKGLLGRPGDYLVDDRPHKAHCEEFEGTLIHFGGEVGWPQVLQRLGIGLGRKCAENSHDDNSLTRCLYPRERTVSACDPLEARRARHEAAVESRAQILYALERQIFALDSHAARLRAQRDYDAAFPVEDADRLREAAAILSQDLPMRA